METLINNLIIWLAIAEIANLIAWKMDPIQIVKNWLRLTWWGFECAGCVGFWFGILGCIFLGYTIWGIFIVCLFSTLIEKHTRLL